MIVQRWVLLPIQLCRAHIGSFSVRAVPAFCRLAAATPTVVAPILGWGLFPEKWGRQGIMGRSRSKRPARKVGFWRRWSGLLWKLALVGVVALAGLVIYLDRSEERRVGKEGRSRGSQEQVEEKGGHWMMQMR